MELGHFGLEASKHDFLLLLRVHKARIMIHISIFFDIALMCGIDVKKKSSSEFCILFHFHPILFVFSKYCLFFLVQMF